MNALCFLVIISFSSWNSINAQNLVNNPTFDTYYTYPDSNNNIVYHPDFWYYSLSTPNHPIYYSADRFLDKAITNNPHPDAELILQGQKINYISILILPNTQKAYTVFKEQLKRGCRYHLSIDIKAFVQSNCLSDLLVGFDECLDCHEDSDLYQIRLSIPDSLANEFLYNNWLTVSKDFTANGKEKVMVISAGSKEDYLKIVNSNPDKFIIRRFDGPYRLKYLVDNIYLAPVEESRNDSSFKESLDSLRIGESLVLQNIYFDFDKYELLETSFPVLDRVTGYLAENKNVRILVSGYTDSIGSDTYNDELSHRRAASVVEYIVKKGIAKNRLESAGFGSLFPIASNNTEEGRQKNRRIEIKVVGK
jgi:outer membrane protein OmpA-like peptidoglycan-associated protein